MSYNKMVLLPTEVYNNIVNSTNQPNPQPPQLHQQSIPLPKDHTPEVQRGGSKSYKRDKVKCEIRKVLKKLTKQQLKSIVK